MDSLKAPSLPSLLDSDRGSCDSLLESSQFDIEELDDTEYSLPPIDVLPTLESVLSELNCEEFDSVVDSKVNSSINSIDLQNFIQNEHSISSYSNSGSILRHVFLQGISSQIQSAHERIKAGLASVIAVHNMIAIGTTHGHILCFDASQTLRWCCADYLSHGAVSALAFNAECTRLLVGYARGHTVMLNTSTGDTLRSVSDCHTPNTAVLALRWVYAAKALCLDSGGSVWSLSFTRHLGVRGCESKCLFSGARGEVCTLEPLLLEEEHPLKAYNITAFATMSKIIVVTLKPRLRVIWTQPLPGNTQYLPLLAWQLVVIQSSDSNKNRDPVLAFARGTELYFNQISVVSGRLRCTMLCRVELSCALLALHWLGPKSIGCIDTRETLRLMDVRSTTEQEAIELGNIGLVYGSAYYKGLATGGNVSPALALAGTHACYNSMASKGSQMLILGHKGVHAVTVRSWTERLQYLTNASRWSEAFTLIIEGYRAAYERPRRQEMVKDKATQLIQDYLSKTQCTPDIALVDVFKCCIELKEESFLWGDLWNRCERSPQSYIEIMVPYILGGTLNYIAPYVSQALVDYYCATNISMLQNLILKLDVTCLDLHQVLGICRKYQLFSAFIYITTQALKDYSLPITELIPILNNFCDNCDHVKKLLQPLSNIEIEHDDNMDNCDQIVINNLYNDECQNCMKTRELGDILLVYISGCLVGKMFPSGDLSEVEGDRVKKEVLNILIATHSSASLSGELPYPYLRSLLEYNPREALNIISLAFQEPHFHGELGQAQRIRVINVLVNIMDAVNNYNEAVGCLLNFIVLQICNQVIPPTGSLFQKVLDYIMSPNIHKMSHQQNSERQQMWIELRNAGYLSHISLTEQIETAKKVHCYRVLENLLEISKNYGDILICYLQDEQRQKQVFHYIEKYARVIEREVYKQVEKNIDELLSLNSEQTAKVVAEFFPDSIDKLIDNITDMDYKYLLLRGLIVYNIQLSSAKSELYLDLLCQKNKTFVIDYLKNSPNIHESVATDIVKKHNHYFALVYLLEKSGDYISAFNILFDMFNKAIVDDENVEQLAYDISDLCNKSSSVLSQEKQESLWFPFLELALSHKNLRGITRELLHTASSHVRLSALVQLIVKSEVGSKFGDIKQILAGMLVNSKYETILLETTSNILNSDLHHILAKDLFKSHHALSIRACVCFLCNKNLSAESECIVYGCGHSFHLKCKNSDDMCTVCGFKYILTSEIQNYAYKRSYCTDEYASLKVSTTYRPDLEGLF